MEAFVLKVGICSGCYSCQITRKDEHIGNDWTPYGKRQPDTGQLWMRQAEYICRMVPKVNMHNIMRIMVDLHSDGNGTHDDLTHVLTRNPGPDTLSIQGSFASFFGSDPSQTSWPREIRISSRVDSWQ